METYIVRVNGEEFEVEIEKKSSKNEKASAAASVAAALKAAAPSRRSPAGKGNGEPVICGTSGKVFKVVAKEGDAVKAGDTIIILEAMKMEIPVVSPKDGTVSKITVSEGDATASGQTVAYVA